MATTTPKVLIRLGSHAEKEYVVKLEQFLDGLIVGANLFEATPGATSSLLLRVGAKNTNLYIDPMTYAFGAYIDPVTRSVREDLNWIKSDQTRKRNGRKREIRDFKRSYKSLAERIGAPLTQAVQESRAITPIVFNDPVARTSFCAKVVQYQLKRITDELKKDDELKDYLNDAPQPAAVFAPYFYVEPSNATDWLSTNLSLMKTTTTLDLKSGIPVHGILCADSRHLDDEEIMSKIRNELPATGISGIWLWFSEFFEDAATENTLTSYRDLVQTLAKDLEVYAMHGGLFSLVLSKLGMAGVSHGTGYGEQKNVVPVIGQSIPMVRYYLPPMAKRLGVPDIERSFDSLDIKNPSDFHDKICDCPVCKGIIATSLDEFSAFGDMYFSRPAAMRPSQTPAAAKRCRFHFLLARLRERNDIRNMELREILIRFRNALQTWGSQPSLYDYSAHLKRWISVLEGP